MKVARLSSGYGYHSTNSAMIAVSSTLWWWWLCYYSEDRHAVLHKPAVVYFA